MSTEFMREDRYIVFKVSDLGNSLKGDEIRKLAQEYAEQRRLKGKKPLECVVVEKDWPEYEPTWKAIEARATGAQPAPSFADAYQGAMEEVAIWKKRALEAEDLNRKFIAEINGPTYMGEPAQPAPSIKDAIIDDLQSQFDTEGITEHDSGDALIRLYAAIAAVEDNFAQPAPSINEGVRKVTLGFRWESEAQHHIPTIEIEFEPVSPDSPNDAKGWQDRDRLAVMLTPEVKP